jgi:hypothetical protein
LMRFGSILRNQDPIIRISKLRLQFHNALRIYRITDN